MQPLVHLPDLIAGLTASRRGMNDISEVAHASSPCAACQVRHGCHVPIARCLNEPCGRPGTNFRSVSVMFRGAASREVLTGTTYGTVVARNPSNRSHSQELRNQPRRMKSPSMASQISSGMSAQTGMQRAGVSIFRPSLWLPSSGNDR